MLDESLPGVKCDRIQVEQVVLNLVRNAMDILEEESVHTRELTIRCRADSAATIELTVEDTGEGFTADSGERMSVIPPIAEVAIHGADVR